MKSERVKASRLKISGIIFIISGVVWLLAAALAKQSVFVTLHAAFIAIGVSFIAQSKKTLLPNLIRPVIIK